VTLVRPFDLLPMAFFVGSLAIAWLGISLAH
jgi:hypothetical protein